MWVPSEVTGDHEALWQSSQPQRRKEAFESKVPLETSHRALYDRVETSLSTGFASVQRALVDLQLQLQLKLKLFREQQENILLSQAPTADQAAEFEENLRKIDRSLEAFTAHAENLAHIKLTLARAAAFVSPEGNLAQLITSQKQRQSGLYDPYGPADGLMSSNVVGRPARGGDFMMRTLLGNGESALGPSLLTSQSSFRPSERLERNLEKERGQDLIERVSQTGSSPRIPNSTCFVFYLPPSATNETLRTLFTRYGTVLNAYVAMDKVTNRTRGFGFVDFSTPSEAQAAVAALDKYPLEGKFLSVSIKV